MVGTGQSSGDIDWNKAEQGNAAAAIGVGLLLECLLVVFFAPASIKVQSASVFITLIVVLAVSGTGLMLWGWNRRRRAS